MPALYQGADGRLYRCEQFQDKRLEGMVTVMPGRGKYKGQTCYEVFTEEGRLVIVEPGDWIVYTETRRIRVIRPLTFLQEYKRL